MIAENDFTIPEWPDMLQQADVVKLRFTLDFTSPCNVQPADFLGLGSALRIVGRQLLDSADSRVLRRWQELFQPPLSDDPVARRRFQKPAPAFVLTMPVSGQTLFQAGDQLPLELLFLGTGIPLIGDFLRSLIQLGQLGLVAGEGRFEVLSVTSGGGDGTYQQVWVQPDRIENLSCPVQPLSWLFEDERISDRLLIKYVTPMRLMVDGKPLRKPVFKQVFPFMLRRVTSLLYAHCGIEILDDPTLLLAQSLDLQIVDSSFRWRDWRPLAGRQNLSVGGFTGEMTVMGEALERVYWVLAAAALFGVGKGASYGAGRIQLCN